MAKTKVDIGTLAARFKRECATPDWLRRSGVKLEKIEKFAETQAIAGIFPVDRIDDVILGVFHAGNVYWNGKDFVEHRKRKAAEIKAVDGFIAASKSDVVDSFFSYPQELERAVNRAKAYKRLVAGPKRGRAELFPENRFVIRMAELWRDLKDREAKIAKDESRPGDHGPFYSFCFYEPVDIDRPGREWSWLRLVDRTRAGGPPSAETVRLWLAKRSTP